MQYPKIKSAQVLVDLILQKKINDIIITPGSRNAPLTIGFTENSYFKTYSLVDERSAAFFALGISQQTKKPSVLVCTSGSAILNYHPAVAEAFYSKIPLVVISADRPAEWIDQGDGQTIRQDNVLSNHVLKSVNLSEGDDEDAIWHNGRLINEAVNIAIDQKGPVHINIPFSEPLYETVDSLEVKTKNVYNPKARPQLEVSELEKYAELWNNSKKKIVLVGAHDHDEQIEIQLNFLSKDPSVLIFTETLSNMHGHNFISSIDQLINNLSEVDLEELKPDILVTFGGMIVSKKIKSFLRSCDMKHWHVGEDNIAPDTYQNLSATFRVDPDMFFSQLFFLKKNVESTYSEKFIKIRDGRIEVHSEFISNTEFSDLKIYDTLLRNIPENIQIQSANSSVIRYFQLFDNNRVEMYCNRGTSGIDGSTSTAIGASLYSDKQVVLVTGDISFFYDSNGLWNKYVPKNFKIILINNGGGSIFKIIPGPSSSPSMEEFFQAKHNLNAKGIAETFGFNYLRADNQEGLESALKRLFSVNTGATILELNTSKVENEKILEEYWKGF